MAKKTITTDANAKPQLNQNTQIVFTIKSFFALITTMLALFFGFYQLVVVPKVNKTEEHYQLMFTDQKEQNRIFYEKLGNINSSIGSLNATIEALNKTTPSTTATVPNSGGSLGGGNSSTLSSMANH